MKLREEFLSLKTSFDNFYPESRVTITLTAESTGELMDLANEHNCVLVKPFTQTATQDHYYFEYELKKNVILKVKSLPKREK